MYQLVRVEVLLKPVLLAKILAVGLMIDQQVYTDIYQIQQMAMVLPKHLTADRMAALETLAGTLLCNPVIEDYRIVSVEGAA